MFLTLKHILWFVSWCLCLGHQEFWERADPSAAPIPSRCRGHEDLPHSVWVPSPAGLQELHPPHHSPGNGHLAAGCQPQQSLRYNNQVLGHTTPCTGGYIYTPQILNCLFCYGTDLYKSLWYHVTSCLMIHQFPLIQIPSGWFIMVMNIPAIPLNSNKKQFTSDLLP